MKMNRPRVLRRNMSEAEAALWRKLRNRRLGGFKFRRQHPVDGYVVDFICIEHGLVVDLDGGQHALQQQKYRRRTQSLETNGLRVIRFWNNDVLQYTDGVLETILRALRTESAEMVGSRPA